MAQATQAVSERRVETDCADRAIRSSASIEAVANIRLSVHTDLAALEPDWREFEQSADGTVFQTFEWLATWQRHIGTRNGVVPAAVVGRSETDDILFLLPFAIETRLGVRCLTWLGSELCDYNGPLLAADFSRRVGAQRFALLWPELTELLQQDASLRYDLTNLEKMPEWVGGQANPFLDLGVVLHPSGAYVADLGDDWTSFYAAKRSSATRQRDRAKHKRLSRFGEVRFVTAESDEEIAHTLDILISQKSRSFARMGVEDIFTRPGYREFFLDIATNLNVRALTHVSRLEIGPTTAATNLGLRFRDSYYLVLSSYHDGELSRFGPGRAHLHELLRHAIEGGLQRFDFTVGDEPYKRDWSDTELRLYDHLAAVTARGMLVVAAMAAYRRAKRFIKQTPPLWHAYLKVRGLAASLARR
jgi:CelD/BcsL family acetyltransferase involved in cellulose biosynthesis